MSIIRVGLAETPKFGQGYEAIFGKAAKGEKPGKPSERAKKPSAKAAKKRSKRK